MHFVANLVIKDGERTVHNSTKNPVGLFYLIRTLFAWKTNYNKRLTYTLTITSGDNK